MSLQSVCRLAHHALTERAAHSAANVVVRRILAGPTERCSRSAAVQIKDEAGKFRHDNFRAMHESFKAAAEKAPKEEAGRAGGRWGSQRGRGRGRGGRGRGGAHQMAGRRDQGDIAADISKILKMIKQRSLEPVIIFSFARRYSPTPAFLPLIAVA